MTSILLYFLQVIACSGLLYGYYHFFLRDRKFHHYNRFYLLASALVSLVIPFFRIPVYFAGESQDAPLPLKAYRVVSGVFEQEGVEFSAKAGSADTYFSWSGIILLVYMLVLALFLFHFVRSLVSIYSIKKRYPEEKIENISFYNTREPGTPYSFLRNLFWNQDQSLDTRKGQQIFRHEWFHITQRHSIDILFLELLTALCWFNPFYHLMKRETKTIHEFLADSYAVHDSADWEYAELLLQQALETQQNLLINPFFHNQIKRRIAMITLSKKTSYQYLRKIMVLPVAVLAILLFSFSLEDKNHFSGGLPLTLVIDPGHGGTDAGAQLPDGSAKESVLCLELSNKIRELGSAYGINVLLTRDEDKMPGDAKTKYEGLKNRLAFVKEMKPDAFVSIHLSSTGKGTTELTGFRAYVSAEDGDFQDKALASSLLSELETVYTTKNEIKAAPGTGIYVLRDNPYPAVLLECGFLNNKSDRDYVSNPVNQEIIARKILEGIRRYADAANTLAMQPVDIPSSDTAPNKAREKQEIFEKLDEVASFPGGESSLKEFLAKNINATVASRNGAPDGKYTAAVVFIVKKDGTLSDIRVLGHPGYGMEEELVRVMKLSPNWDPGKVNGKEVNSLFKQPVSFVVSGKNKNSTPKNVETSVNTTLQLQPGIHTTIALKESIVLDKVALVSKVTMNPVATAVTVRPAVKLSEVKMDLPVKVNVTDTVKLNMRPVMLKLSVPAQPVQKTVDENSLLPTAAQWKKAAGLSATLISIEEKKAINK